MIRPASATDVDAIRDIEVAAGRLFAAIGMNEIAGDQPPPVTRLNAALERGDLFVSVMGAAPVAFLLLEPVDARAHIEQVSVHPEYARRRLGAALIGYAAQVAAVRGVDALTLTTFQEVPWNAPYYRRLGFTCLGDDQLSPGLRAVREHERALGLDRWPRSAMIKAIGPAGQIS